MYLQPDEEIESLWRRQTRDLVEQARLLDLASDAILVRDPDGRIRFWNTGAEQLYGWTRAEALQHTTHDLLETSFPQPLDDILHELRLSGSWRGELVHKTKTGRTIVVDSRWSLKEDGDGGGFSILEVNTDVTERKRLEEARDAFISNAAHELRTPMTSILGFIEVLATEDHLTEDQRRDALDALQRSAKRLRLLVDRLLDLNRLQHGDIHLVPEPLDIGRTLQEVVRDVPHTRGAVAQVHVPRGLEAAVDRDALAQILTALLTNAYLYGGDNVSVRAALEDGHVVVEVEDDGPGIEPELREVLFDPFTRGTSQESTTGSGLGLALARVVAERLAGTLEHRDRSGGGAVFTLRLPHSS